MTPLNSRVCRIATLALSATLVAGCTSSSSEPASHRGKEFAGSCLFAEYSQCVDFLGSEYIAQTVENDECGVSGKFSADPCDTHMNHLGSQSLGSKSQRNIRLSSLCTSLGVRYPRVLRGRELSASSTALSSESDTSLKSVPFGK
jgi:hypothetical protein